MIDEGKLISELKQSGMIIDNDYGNSMVDFINSQPKINEWIPCSEKLPEIGSDVIITDDDGYVWDNINYSYAYETDNEPCFHRWDDEYWTCLKPCTIAWMPLPEPYKKEEKL